MRDGLREIKQRLACEIDSYSVSTTNLIAADPWIVSSLLQKSIRRSETEIAQRAAVTLVQLKGAAIWRRLIVIAFEDIGIGSVDAVATTVAAADDSAWRKAHGGDIRLAVAVAGILAEAPKDRSADYLVGAKDHPLLTGFAQEMASASLPTRLSRIGSRALDLPHRAVATFLVSGTGTRNAERETLLSAFRGLGVAEELVAVHRRGGDPNARADHGHGPADLAVGQEHGRTIPLTDMRANLRRCWRVLTNRHHLD
jgi:hypothetical protein